MDDEHQKRLNSKNKLIPLRKKRKLKLHWLCVEMKMNTIGRYCLTL